MLTYAVLMAAGALIAALLTVRLTRPARWATRHRFGRIPTRRAGRSRA